MPWMWDIIEWGNSELFALQHHRCLKELHPLLEKYSDKFTVVLAQQSDVAALARFFTEQPREAFQFFKPHGFDEKSLRKLINRKSFLMFLVKDSEAIVGYFFLRCFVNGKSFRGKIVDYRWQGCGIAKLMGRVSTDIAVHLGLRLFGTISKDNIASMASSSAVNEIKIIEHLPNDFVYIEYLPKK